MYNILRTCLNKLKSLKNQLNKIILGLMLKLIKKLFELKGNYKSKKIALAAVFSFDGVLKLVYLVGKRLVSFKILNWWRLIWNI